MFSGLWTTPYPLTLLFPSKNNCMLTIQRCVDSVCSVMASNLEIHLPVGLLLHKKLD